MSNLSHFLNNASIGRNTPQLIGNLPLNSTDILTSPNYPTLNQLQWNGSVNSSECINMLPFSPNGSVRGSILCAGIMPNNSSGVGTRTLRQEPIDESQGIYAPQGYGNAQQPGLAFLDAKPINVLPILNSVSQINPSLINPIPQPGFFNNSF